jgi:hypothetical protein
VVTSALPEPRRPRRGRGVGRRRPFRAGGRGDAGSMALEVVLITPVLVVFMLMVVAFGRLVWVRGQVEAASRDAARAASLERELGPATDAAARVVDDQLLGRADCTGGLDLPGTTFEAGGVVNVRLTCEVSYSQLGLLGIGASTTVTAESSAPLDINRRTGDGPP